MLLAHPIPDNRIALQEPYRRTMPYFIFGIGQRLSYLSLQSLADSPKFTFLLRDVLLHVLFHLVLRDHDLMLRHHRLKRIRLFHQLTHILRYDLPRETELIFAPTTLLGLRYFR